jgi:hypothetical protein
LNSQAAIAIPIYKENLSTSEKNSLQQCLKIFPNKKIVFVAPKGLQVKDYNVQGLERCDVVYFNPLYFTNVAGYNRLLLSKHFYKSFNVFKFILIYQLDAWVFADHLDLWCNKGYSYVGAPWFENFEESNSSNKLWATGNGGFSLRKVDDFLQVFEVKEKLFSFQFLWSKYLHYSFFNKLLRLPKLIIQYYWKNKPEFLYELFGENEDHFWSFHAKELNTNFTVANVEDAVSFAFECNPKKMFELNNNQLPFGIHAWEKYDARFVTNVLFNIGIEDS